MKALVVNAIGRGFDFEDVDIATPIGREVLVDVQASGLCHTDLLFATRDFVPTPAVLGHEVAGVVASGWHTAAITMRLLVDSGLPIAGGIVGAGGEIAWPRPVRPGAVLHVESEILELRPSRSRPDRGMATVRSETRNQLGEVVQ